MCINVHNYEVSLLLFSLKTDELIKLKPHFFYSLAILTTHDVVVYKCAAGANISKFLWSFYVMAINEKIQLLYKKNGYLLTFIRSSHVRITTAASIYQFVRFTFEFTERIAIDI